MTINPFFCQIPTAELHIHIEGSLEPEMMFALSDRNKIQISYKSVKEIRTAYNFQNLQSFLDLYYAGMSVLQTEQVVDTGLSTTKAIEILKTYNPASVKLCALLDKPSRRKVPVQIDYLGIEIPDRFIVGYGIDMDEKYRQLPAIHALEQ